VNPLRFSARAILFDWDGTLLDSYKADSRAYVAMFREFGIEWTERHFARHYSPNWYRVYVAARLPRKHWKQADHSWTAAYKAEKPPLPPGAREVIRALRERFLLGIVTSGDRDRVRRQLREFCLAADFSAVICSQDTAKRKPHPAPLRAALARLGTSASEAIYVGDTAEDIEMARRAGVRAIGVLGPFPTAKRLKSAKPDLLLKSVRKLPYYLHPEKGENT